MASVNNQGTGRLRLTAKWTAVFLPAVFGVAGWQLTRLLHPADPVWFTLWFTVTIITLIMLHELAHLLVGLWFGLIADRITIGPWGARCRFVGNLGQIANRSHFVIALAGPLSQVIISVGLARAAASLGADASSGFVAACVVSVLMGVMNLIPAPQMDGWIIVTAGWRTLTGRGRDPYLPMEDANA